MKGGNKQSQNYYKVFSKKTFLYNKTIKKEPLLNVLITNGFNIMQHYIFVTYKLTESYKTLMIK